MNKSIKNMEKEILKAVLPPRKRLSFSTSRHREQVLMTPQIISKNRSAHSTGAKMKSKPNSGVCHRKWNSRLVSSPQPCERCVMIHTTPRVRKEFEMNMLATSPCVNKTRGGCSPDCGYFPRNVLEGEKPVVLCRHCFYALHRYVEFWVTLFQQLSFSSCKALSLNLPNILLLSAIYRLDNFILFWTLYGCAHGTS